jgi:amino acid transporter
VSDAPSTRESDSGTNELRSGVLGLFDSVIMAIAGSAPAYSIAGTTVFLFAAVGLGGPAALLYCGIFMFGIIFAFNYLSKSDSHAGATYSWVRKALHPALGFLAGWSLIVSALIFMVVATFPAGSTILDLFSSSAASNKLAVTIFGCLFFLLMVGAVAAGVTVTVNVQIIMSCIEVVLLILFAFLAIFHAHHVHSFSWHWFSPSVFPNLNTFTSGALLAAFYYWGWDVTANLNEETKNARKTSGLGGLLGGLIVFLLFEIFTVGTNMVVSTGQMNNPNNSADILAVLGQDVWHGFGGKLVVVAVLLSTIATLETTLIQVTRTFFTMGRDRTLPSALGRTHLVRKTPLVATFLVTAISLCLFVASNYVGSISNILTDGYNAIGLQICIYYGLAGLAVVVLYRRQIFKSVSNFIFMAVWPLLGAVFMGFIFERDVPQLNGTTLWVGLGSVAAGVIPMAYYWIKGSPYFELPSKEDRHAVLEEFAENF